MGLMFQATIICIICADACSALQYTDWPGLVRTHQGQSAAFSWRLDTSLDQMSNEEISFSYRKPGDNFPISIYSNTPADGEVIHDDYLSRMTAEYEDGNHRMTFTLSGMQEDDITGEYECRLFLQGQNYVNNNVTLFLYKIPEDTAISPNPATTRESDTFTLTCSVTLTSSPVSLRPGVGYTWTRNDGPLPARHRVEGPDGQRLVISPVHRDDNQQKYTCVAQETGSSFSGSTETQLDVQYKPGNPVLEASETQLTEGSNLDLTCSLTSDKDGNPDIYTYRWWNSEFSHVYVTQTNTKQVNNLKVTEHDGRWRCEVNNSIGIGQSDALDVNVDAPAHLHQSPTTYIEQLYSDTLSELCEFRAKPGARVSWTYNGGPTVPAAIRIHDSGNRTQDKFTFTSSTLQWEPGASDSQRRGSGGIYRCHGDNNVGGVASSGDINITILYGPVYANVTPTQVTAIEGNHVTLTCSSDCSPSCTYTWSRLNDDTFNHAGPVLSFQSIDRDAHDTYSCETTNVHGSKSASADVRVNFSSEIKDFSPSSGELFHGDAVVLMCSVDSRPTSTIVIIHNTMELARSNDSNSSYPFNSISILDSGEYMCEAGNGVGPSVSDSISLDIKGGFHFCDNHTNHDIEGIALNAMFQQDICQFANPFTDVSRDNWVFVTSNETRTQHTLPDDVNITIIPTDHQYRNTINFYIPRISQTHFGTYTMTNRNGHGDELVYSLELTPEGPPEAPYNLVCTKTTAISLYLQWNAGYDGGPDQVFELTYKNPVSSIAHRVQIDGAGVQQGEVVEYKLIDNDTILPEQTYIIQVDARNTKGHVTGPTVVNATLAQISFEDDPVIEVVDDTAYITWTISNLESVSHIIISACDSNVENNCKLTNITDPYIQPYEASLPVADKVYYVFTFYDMGDVLYVHEDRGHNPAGRSKTMIIVGAVLGVAAALVIISVMLVLWRKGKFTKQDTPQRSNGNGVSYDNPLDSDLAEEVSPYSSTSATARSNTENTEPDHISPYGSTPATRLHAYAGDRVEDISPYGSTSATRHNSPTNSPTPEESTKDVYAEVKKDKKPNTDIYSEVKKDKRKPGKPPKPNISREAGTSGATPRPVSVYPPSKAPTHAGDIDPEQKYGMGIASKNKSTNKTISNEQAGSRNKHGVDGQQYENIGMKVGKKEGPYSEVCIPGIATTNLSDTAYQNFNELKESLDIEDTKPFVGDDGITYARLSMMDEALLKARALNRSGAPPPPPIIRGSENKVDYATIDCFKTQQQQQ